MRRKEKEITDRPGIDAVIRGCQVCHLAFAVENVPYVVPLSFGYDGAFLYFHTAAAGKKIDCLRANPLVCFQMERNVELVSDSDKPCNWTFRFESVIGTGRAQELQDDADKQHALGWIVRQYGASGDKGAMRLSAALKVWRIVIDEVSAKRS